VKTFLRFLSQVVEHFAVYIFAAIRDARRLTYAKAMQIKLSRPKGAGMGFILRGGMQEHTGRNFPLTVVYIRPGSPAAEYVLLANSQSFST
jgi:hypothetical protein